LLKKRTSKFLAFIIVLTLIVFLSYPIYFIEDWVGGTLLWNANEAYLFSGWSGSGGRYTPFTLLIALVPAYFGAVADPKDKGNSTVVFHITPDAIVVLPSETGLPN
jgi:hypothetical protein